MLKYTESNVSYTFIIGYLNTLLPAPPTPTICIFNIKIIAISFMNL